MIKLFWRIVEFFVDNHGYSTQIQRRFKVGDRVIISDQVQPLHVADISPGDEVKILGTARHDYLVINKRGDKAVVYQYELEKKKDGV